MEDSMGGEVPHKIKTRTAIWSISFTSGYLPKEIKTLIIKDVHVSVHRGIIFCSQDVKARDMEPRCPSIDEWRIHTHTHTQA